MTQQLLPLPRATPTFKPKLPWQIGENIKKRGAVAIFLNSRCNLLLKKKNNLPNILNISAVLHLGNFFLQISHHPIHLKSEDLDTIC